MKLLGIFLAPWVAVAEARNHAERQLAVNARLRGALGEMQRVADELRVERDEAWQKLARRSAGVSRGNRTKALRRRGALLPAPFTDIPGHPADLRTELTG